MSKKVQNESVKVFIRIRPLNKEEIEIGSKKSIYACLDKQIVLKKDEIVKEFNFDKVFRESTTQSAVYDIVVDPMIAKIIRGINCTVLTYGQSGTGKTYTLTGTNILNKDVKHLGDPDGLIIRTAKQLFEDLEKLNDNISYTVRISFIEIDNEVVRDLLCNSKVMTPSLAIYDDISNKGSVKIGNITEVTALDVNDVFKYLQIGTKQLDNNKEKSRSHSIFTITLHTREPSKKNEPIQKVSKLNMVDLAGSENINRQGHVNKSLRTLGKIIKSLAKKKSPHECDPYTSYKESKLTTILQGSLGGNSNTSIIATISPSSNCWGETVNTLEYVTLAKGIENNPEVNEYQSDLFLHECYREVAVLQRELDAAKMQQGVYMTNENYQQINGKVAAFNAKNKDLTHTIENLTTKIDKLAVTIENTEIERQQLEESFEETNQHKLLVEHELMVKNRKIKEQQYLLDYYVERDNKVTDDAVSLLDACQVSTKTEEILHHKYRNAMDLSSKNIQVTQNLHNCLKSGLNRIEETTYQFCSNHQVYIEKLKHIVGNLVELKDMILQQQNERMETFRIHSPAMNSLMDVCIDGNRKINLELLADELSSRCSHQAKNCTHSEVKLKTFEQNYKKTRRDMLSVHVDKYKDNVDVKDLERSNEMQQICESQLKVLTTSSLMNQLPTLLHTFIGNNANKRETEICVKDKIKECDERLNVFLNDIDRNADFTNLSTAMIESYSDCQQALEASKTDCVDVMKNYTTNITSTFNSIPDKMVSSCNFLLENLEIFIANLNHLTDCLVSTILKLNSDMKNFIAHTYNTIERIYNNVEFLTNEGNTPVRKSYAIPTSIQQKQPVKVLRSKFKETLLLKVDDIPNEHS